MCFIISTPNSIAEIVTNYEKLQNCDKNDCKSISDDKFKKIYNVYKNFKKIPDIQKINAVIWFGVTGINYSSSNLFILPKK